MGAGAASLYVPRYVSEVSPISIRGGLATLNQARPTSLLLCGLLACTRGAHRTFMKSVQKPLPTSAL